MMRRLEVSIVILTALLLLAGPAAAGGYTNWAKPTLIEWVDNGLLISGTFGDTNSCGRDDFILIRPTPGNPDAFKLMASMAMMALSGDRELRFYSQECVGVSFHFSGNVINAAHWGAMFVR